MDILRKHLQPSAEDGLFKKLHPVLLDTFSMGVRNAKSRNLILGSSLMLAFTPVSLVTSILFKFASYISLFIFWVIFNSDINQAGISTPLFIGLSVLFVNYKDIVEEIASIIGHSINILTAGSALKIVCNSYLSGSLFGEIILSSDKMSVLITSFIAVIPKKYGNKYDQLFKLYTTSNQTGDHEELLEAIKNHQKGDSISEF